MDRLPNDSGSAAIGVFLIYLHGHTATSRPIACRTASSRSPPDSKVHRARKCRSDARRCLAHAQIAQRFHDLAHAHLIGCRSKSRRSADYSNMHRRASAEGCGLGGRRSCAYSSTIFERHESKPTFIGSAPVTSGSSSNMAHVSAEQHAEQLHVKTPRFGSRLFIEKASTSAHRTNKIHAQRLSGGSHGIGRTAWGERLGCRIRACEKATRSDTDTVPQPLTRTSVGENYLYASHGGP